MAAWWMLDHLEDPWVRVPVLSKDHIVGLGEDLQVVGPLHQHPGLAGPADA